MPPRFVGRGDSFELEEGYFSFSPNISVGLRMKVILFFLQIYLLVLGKILPLSTNLTTLTALDYSGCNNSQSTFSISFSFPLQAL